MLLRLLTVAIVFTNTLVVGTTSQDVTDTTATSSNANVLQYPSESVRDWAEKVGSLGKLVEANDLENAKSLLKSIRDGALVITSFRPLLNYTIDELLKYMKKDGVKDEACFAFEWLSIRDPRCFSIIPQGESMPLIDKIFKNVRDTDVANGLSLSNIEALYRSVSLILRYEPNSKWLSLPNTMLKNLGRGIKEESADLFLKVMKMYSGANEYYKCYNYMLPDLFYLFREFETNSYENSKTVQELKFAYFQLLIAFAKNVQNFSDLHPVLEGIFNARYDANDFVGWVNHFAAIAISIDGIMLKDENILKLRVAFVIIEKFGSSVDISKYYSAAQSLLSVASNIRSDTSIFRMSNILELAYFVYLEKKYGDLQNKGSVRSLRMSQITNYHDHLIDSSGHKINMFLWNVLQDSVQRINSIYEKDIIEIFAMFAMVLNGDASDLHLEKAKVLKDGNLCVVKNRISIQNFIECFGQFFFTLPESFEIVMDVQVNKILKNLTHEKSNILNAETFNEKYLNKILNRIIFFLVEEKLNLNERQKIHFVQTLFNILHFSRHWSLDSVKDADNVPIGNNFNQRLYSDFLKLIAMEEMNVPTGILHMFNMMKDFDDANGLLFVLLSNQKGLEIILSVVFKAIDHTDIKISKVGLEICYNMLMEYYNVINNHRIAQRFYENYFIEIFKKVFSLLVNGSHKESHQNQFLILSHMFNLVKNEKLKYALHDSQAISNLEILKGIATDILVAHQKSKIESFVGDIINSSDDAFKFEQMLSTFSFDPYFPSKKDTIQNFDIVENEYVVNVEPTKQVLNFFKAITSKTRAGIIKIFFISSLFRKTKMKILIILNVISRMWASS
ncbi:hypothetical protein ROZALSC1DRAFT_30742, partial [Rozella allomycis CSF55]